GGVQVELDDAHGRRRRQVVRVEHAEQGVGQLGELVVELVVDAAGQQRERLDEAFDVRVGAAVGLQQQPAGGGGVLLGELLGQLADEQQLALVVREQGFAHDASLGWMMARPVVNSRRVSNATSGAGSTLSWASMWKRTMRSRPLPLSTRRALTLRSRGSKRAMMASMFLPISCRWCVVTAGAEARSGRP